jgi:hypothetical protein
MDKYRIKWRRIGQLFWNIEKDCIGHKTEGNDFIIYYSNKGLKKIPEWSRCEMILGNDWFQATVSQAKKQTGISLNLEE